MSLKGNTDLLPQLQRFFRSSKEKNEILIRLPYEISCLSVSVRRSRWLSQNHVVHMYQAEIKINCRSYAKHSRDMHMCLFFLHFLLHNQNLQNFSCWAKVRKLVNEFITYYNQRWKKVFENPNIFLKLKVVWRNSQS